MNTEALKKLAANAKAFGTAYVQVKEELMRQGVPAKEASDTARHAALVAAMSKDEGDGPSWE